MNPNNPRIQNVQSQSTHMSMASVGTQASRETVFVQPFPAPNGHLSVASSILPPKKQRNKKEIAKKFNQAAAEFAETDAIKQLGSTGKVMQMEELDQVKKTEKREKDAFEALQREAHSLEEELVRRKRNMKVLSVLMALTGILVIVTMILFVTA